MLVHAGGPARSSEEAPVMGVERRGLGRSWLVHSINRTFSGRSLMDGLKSPDKPFEISKWLVEEAWEKVRANKAHRVWMR